MSKYHERPNIFVTDLVLRVEDLERSKEFYMTIMGFKVLKEEEARVVFTVDGISPIMTIIRPKVIGPKIPRRTGLYHFAVLLPDRLQLGLFFKNITEKNYHIVGGSHHGVSEAIYLEDPDENGIEVYADTNEEEWDRHDYSVNMVTERLDYSELRAHTGDQVWEGAPKSTIIGHIHLHVADLDDSFKFYSILGFELTQAMRHTAYFISTGGYHHHIGMNLWNGKGSPPLPKNAAGMEYFTLKLPNEEIRTEKVRLFREAGYGVIETKEGIFVNDPSENSIKLDI